MLRETARDCVAIVGLGMVGGGCWLVSAALALIVVGSLLLGGVVWGYCRDGIPR